MERFFIRWRDGPIPISSIANLIGPAVSTICNSIAASIYSLPSVENCSTRIPLVSTLERTFHHRYNDTTSWTDVQTVETEKIVNQYIIENRELLIYYVTNEQLKTLPVVKMPKVTENIRIVEIEGIEYNPCGGTHVEQTGEIGL